MVLNFFKSRQSISPSPRDSSNLTLQSRSHFEASSSKGLLGAEMVESWLASRVLGAEMTESMFVPRVPGSWNCRVLAYPKGTRS